MDTMHYEEKKKSAKGPIIGLLVFCIIGSTIIYFATKNEPEPAVLGSTGSDIQKLVDIDGNQSAQTMTKNQNIKYSVSDKEIKDKSNVKIKSDMVLPIISVEGEELSDINSKINEEYTKMYDGFKTQMSNTDSNYTYKVSYNIYDNMIGTQKILSISFYQRMLDDSAKKNSMEKLKTVNIDLETKKEIQQSDILLTMFGKDYKTIIKQKLRDYVVSKNMMKEDEYVYALTGLESFYIKDSKLHIIFNNGELVGEKYGILDITIE